MNSFLLLYSLDASRWFILLKQVLGDSIVVNGFPEKWTPILSFEIVNVVMARAASVKTGISIVLFYILQAHRVNSQTGILWFRDSSARSKTYTRDALRIILKMLFCMYCLQILFQISTYVEHLWETILIIWFRYICFSRPVTCVAIDDTAKKYGQPGAAAGFWDWDSKKLLPNYPPLLPLSPHCGWVFRSGRDVIESQSAVSDIYSIYCIRVTIIADC